MTSRLAYAGSDKCKRINAVGGECRSQAPNVGG